ncbi:hypothetical protein GGD63_006145 [Bradyrhizobium sp. cir1]|uniref:hypothetical protein n=1 Tax=Bradyrhizobium sp. cir1 TaxID=1445730 RepID=UPI001606719E|nr:hypothetical protein [Bradyrhizobium sp. cir1]MBB4373323.1 hypothetical protein [Bradyrhizobium sp. cir1]
MTTFSSEFSFALKRQHLAGRLLLTVREFARDHGLQDLDEAALRQMAVKVDDVAGELLMFGCDHWPESARGEDKAAA